MTGSMTDERLPMPLDRTVEYSPLSFLREHRTALAEHEVARLAEDLARGRLHAAPPVRLRLKKMWGYET